MDMNTNKQTRYWAPNAGRERTADLCLENRVLAEDLNAYIDGEQPMMKQQVLEQLMASDCEVRLWVDELIQVRALVRLAYGATRND